MASSNERRVALVLAGSKGLGRACAEELASRGHRTVICSRHQANVDTAVDELQAHGGDVAGVVADVSDPASLEELFDWVDHKHGRLDILVVNAGGPPAGGFFELDDSAWRFGFELTLMSGVRAIRRGVDLMRKTAFGRIIVIGSSSVRKPLPGLVLSNALRPALAGVVKSLAVELGASGITINLVAPGRIDTDRVGTLDARAAAQNGTSPAEERAASERDIPLMRYGRAEEFAALVGFLTSDQAGYITGQSIQVDGGLVPTLP